MRLFLALLLLPGPCRAEERRGPLTASAPVFGSRLDLALPLTVAPLSGLVQLRFGGPEDGFALRNAPGLTRFELAAGTALQAAMFSMALLGLFAPGSVPAPFRGKGRPPPLTGIEQQPRPFPWQAP